MSHDDFFAELGIQRDEDAGDAKDKPKSRRQRRMEKVAEVRGVTLYDDFARLYGA